MGWSSWKIQTADGNSSLFNELAGCQTNIPDQQYSWALTNWLEMETESPTVTNSKTINSWECKRVRECGLLCKKGKTPALYWGTKEHLNLLGHNPYSCTRRSERCNPVTWSW